MLLQHKEFPHRIDRIFYCPARLVIQYFLLGVPVQNLDCVIVIIIMVYRFSYLSCSNSSIVSNFKIIPILGVSLLKECFACEGDGAKVFYGVVIVS